LEENGIKKKKKLISQAEKGKLKICLIWGRWRNWQKNLTMHLNLFSFSLNTKKKYEGGVGVERGKELGEAEE